MENFENQEHQGFAAQESAPQEPICQQPAPQEPIYQQPAPQEPICQQPAPQEPICQQPAEAAAQPNPQPQPQTQTYHGTGAGRKESPFANSPYVTRQEQEKAAQGNYGASYIPPVPPQKPKAQKEKKKGGKGWKIVLCTILILVLVAGSCGVTALLVTEYWRAETGYMVASLEGRIDDLQTQIDSGKAEPQDPVIVYQDGYMAPGAVYQKNVQAVVLITCEVRGVRNGQPVTGISTGSGFVVSQNGYVVTNHHVVEGAVGIAVTMYDGTEYAATLIGSDSTNDVAVLKINESVSLQPVEIGSSEALNVGDQVVAIGNPLGELTSTLTVGYVSAKERSVNTDGLSINMIQTDAAINSGNSGGPLFNSKGQVIGITTAKYSGSSSSGASIEGIGFAIPIDDVMPIIKDLMQYGYVNSAYLGVMVSDVDAASATYYGLPVGAYVQEVTPGYCAQKAGLQEKDIIVALGEHKVRSVSELTRILRKFSAGDTTTITVFRSGREVVLTITLDEKPRENAGNLPAPGSGDMPQEGNYEDWYNYFAPYFGDQG